MYLISGFVPSRGNTQFQKREFREGRKPWTGFLTRCIHGEPFSHAELYQFICEQMKLKVVATAAGSTSLMILLRILSAETCLASPASPWRAFRRALIEHTNPDKRKKSATQKFPPVIMSLRNGRWKKYRSCPGFEL
jgi:hypothetical protein